METTITLKVRSKDMINIFDNKSSRINVKHFQARNFDDQDNDEENVYTYDITIRHPEDKNPIKQFKSVLKTIHEVEALQNFADKFSLVVKEKIFEDHRKKSKYMLIKNKTCISPILNYNELNNFLLGMNSCKNYQI